MAALVAAGLEPVDFTMGSPSLDEVFFALTGHRTGGCGVNGGSVPADLDAGAAAAFAFSNAIAFGWRAVLKFRHVPEQLFDLVMTPIMFTLLFTFVFGGALAGSPREYLQFFLPGFWCRPCASTRSIPGWGCRRTSGRGCSTGSGRCRSGRWRPSPG